MSQWSPIALKVEVLTGFSKKVEPFLRNLLSSLLKGFLGNLGFVTEVSKDYLRSFTLNSRLTRIRIISKPVKSQISLKESF